MKQTISILVENQAGVLNRITGLFSRRAFNIESLAVGVTDDPTVSRITIIVDSGNSVVEQVEKQLNKLVDVRDIKILEPDASVIRELILVKVRVSQANRQNVTSIAEIFRAKVVDVSVDSMVLELTGSKSKLEAFLQLLADGNEILELARTGVSGLSRGSDYVLVL